MRTNLIRNHAIAVSHHELNGWTVFEVDGEIDLHTAPQMREAAIGLLDQGHRYFVLDLCFVPFLDSTGLGAVVAITKRIKACQGSLRIACPSPRIRRVFEINSLQPIYDFYDSPQDATQHAPTPDGLAHWPHPAI
ncbi:STAS domain-containing protein [Streptomyces sp. NPDC059466]|uniref:STAS domain-containing protein n=1 Tax=unclassified Streptomyces TaxID=2593676 RepID=UPI00369BC7FB